jgi:hypothetical protein
MAHRALNPEIIRINHGVYIVTKLHKMYKIGCCQRSYGSSRPRRSSYYYGSDLISLYRINQFMYIVEYLIAHLDDEWCHAQFNLERLREVSIVACKSKVC